MGRAAPASKMFVDRIQKRAFKIINSNLVTDSIDSLKHRRTVGALSLFYRYFHGLCSREIFNIMPGVSNPSVRTRNVTHSHPYIVHIEFCSTDHFRNSFIPRTSRL